jgi:hypothetical protein
MAPLPPARAYADQVRKLIIWVALVALVWAGAFFAWRAIVPNCTADHLPTVISGFHQTSQTRASIDQLPPRTGEPQGRPAVVVDLRIDGTCPSYSAGEPDLPVGIWLRVSPSLFVMYVRGGGP